MKNIAYLGVYELDNGYFAGGLMVCDHRGLPVDFRYVEPIKPTKLQRLIYGGALRRYLMVEAIGAGLLKECNSNYELAFVDDALLLELSEHCRVPVVRIEHTNHHPLKARGDWVRVDGNGITFQALNSGAPVNLHYKEDDGKMVEGLMDELAAIGETLDIGEPLERVKKAVAEVGGGSGENRS